MLKVMTGGRVAQVRPIVPIQKDKVPHRREVEQALLVLRAKHGSTSGRELDILQRAFTNVILTEEEKLK